MRRARHAASAAGLLLLLVAALTLFSSPTPAKAQDSAITVAIAAGEGIAVVNGENRVEGDSFNVTITFSEDIGTTFTHSDVTASNADTITAADLTTDTAGLVFTLTVRPTAGFSGDLTLQVGAGVATDADSRANAQSNLFTAAVTVKSACITGGAVAASAPDLAGDCAVLLDLHDQLTGSATLSPAWSVTTAIGSWQGITIRDSRVGDLELARSSLDGTLPAELGQLSGLTELYLNSNQLTGTIPAELGNLSKLRELTLHENMLTGAIPAELGSLPLLERMVLSTNRLTGTIPGELGSLSSLWGLWLTDNQLTGAIPGELGSLPALRDLKLSNNQLTGSIPPELGSLPALEELILYSNQLTGSIPPELGSLSALEVLELSRNRLSGAIPAEIGSLSNVTQLSLYTNQLTGPLPAALGNMAALEHFHANNNEITGSIPAELGRLTNLEVLLLYENNLSGNIPAALGDLSKLESLWLHDNQLEGIPASLSKLQSLEGLLLYENRLTGSIPDLSNMAELTFLSLGKNQLTGSIPALGNMPKLHTLHLHCNQLSGNIPAALGSLTALKNISLRDNDLTGEIPDLTALTNLNSLSVHYNYLEGDFTDVASLLAKLPTVSYLRIRLNANRFDGVDPITGALSEPPSWLDPQSRGSCAPRVSFILDEHSVAEGDTVEVTVVLSADPGQSVVIPLAADKLGAAEDADFTLPESITFDEFESGESTKTGTITFTAVQDMTDDDDEGVSVRFGTLPEGIRPVARVKTTVSIIDDDHPDVQVSYGLAEYTAAEGGSVTVTVKLDADPERTVVIPVTHTARAGATGADYFGVPANVTFDAEDTSKTFTFSATDDTVDDDDEEVLLGFGAGLPAGVSTGTPATSTVTITDDDVPQVRVEFAQASHSVAEGNTVTVNVTLSADPERTVVIPILAANEDGASGADYSVTASVTFESGETAKGVTFTAAQDDIDDDGESVLLEFGTLPDRVSEPATNPSATVTILDDDARGVIVSPTSLPVDEGMTAEYTVVLKSEPTGSVTVTVKDPTDNTDVTAGPASLTFDENDWDTPQTVTVSAVQDADGVDDPATVTHTVSGADYARETVSDVIVTVDDDETPGLTIDPTGFTVVPGGSNEYTVVLDTEPTVPVTVTITGHEGTDLTVGPEELTFDENDWDTPQTVTVSAGGTAETDNVTLSHDPSGGEYGLLADEDVEISIVKGSGALNVQVGVTGSPQSLTVPEDQSRTYSVFLSAVPTGDVTVAITLPTGNDLSIDRNALTFTVDNWNVPQDVRVTAADDDDGIPDAKITIGNAVSGGGYGSGDSFDVEVTIEENDTPAVALSTVSLVIADGETDTYTVALDTQPSDDVTVVINDPTDNTDVTASPGSLTFTPTDWKNGKTVTVTTVADHDTDTETATITHTVSGGDYAAVTAKNVDVTVTDGCEVIWCGVLVMEKDPRFTRELRTVSLDDDDFDYGGQYYRIYRPKMSGGYGGADPQETFDLTVRMPERAWFELNVLGPLYETKHYLDWTLYVNGVELPFSEAKTYWADLPGNWRILFVWYGREFHDLYPPGEQGTGTTLYLSIAETPLADRTPKVTGPPLYLRAETRNRDELRAGWTRPQMRNDDDHNLYVDSYKIQWKKSAGSWETPADVTEVVYTPSGPRFFYGYIIEGLPPGVEYDVRVIATNAAGDSDPSNVATGMIEPDSSGQQSNSPATGGPGIQGVARAGETLTATTSGIRDDDGRDNAVFAYQWVRSELGAKTGTDIVGATGPSYVVTAEDEGKAITVRVTFKDDVGNRESVISNAVVAAAALPQTRAPGPPGAPDVSPRDSTSLAVTWTAPASDGGSAVTGYKVQWKEAADSWDTPADVSEAAATGTSHTITGLTGGTEYSVRVLAINDVGEGLPSDDGSGTPRETVPPELSGASVDGATLTLTFNEALDEDSKPATTAFTVTVGGNVRAVDYVDVIGGAVTLTLASAVTSQDTVTVSYTVPASASAERLRDAVGNAAASFTGRSVTNDTGPAAPLTASVHDAPESHNGTDAFTFELRFSETPRRGFSYETLRDHAFTVTGGDVVRAKRLERGKNVRWEITVRPDSNGAVTIVLPATTDCAAAGAICTGDGRMLSNRLELTVSGPDG